MATTKVSGGALPISKGGTGATTAANAVKNLGAIRGSRSGSYKQIGYIVADSDASQKRIYYYDKDNNYIGYVTYT